MPSLVFDVSAMDRASQAFERIANKVDMLIARLVALNSSSANPRLDVDTDPADRTLGRWAMDFRRKVREAMANIPTVNIGVSSAAAEADIRRIRAELSSLLDKEIGVDINAADAVAEIERLKAELRALDLAGADIQVKADVAAAIADLEAVLAAARRVDGADATVDVKVDQKGFKDVLNQMALFNRTLTQLARGPGLVLAIPGIVSLLDSLTDLLGLLGLVPGLAAGAIAAIAALTVGFQGFGTALSAANGDELNKALKELTPNAQAAVLSIRGLADEWDRVQKATQNALFDGVAAAIDRLGTMLPTVQAGLQGIAAAFGDAFIQWANWASLAGPTQQLAVIFENVRAAVALLGPGITFVAQALTDMAVVGARMLPDLAQGFTTAAQGFANFIAEVTANGQFEAWIRGAYEVVQQLGEIVVNTWTGFQGLFDAVNAGGQTFLQTLVGWTQAFTEFTNSVEGAEVLSTLFDAMRQMAAGVGPAIAGIFNTIATAIVSLAPAVESVGKFFAEVFDSVAVGVGVLGIFTSALAPVVDGLTALLDFLGPIPGVVLGAFLAFRLAGTILAGVATVIGVVVTALGALATAVGAIGLAGFATAVTGLGVALTSVATFLTGPWGFAILGAVAAIALLVGSSEDAAGAAREHQAAVDALAGSLNQYTGAITEATQQQIAQDLAARKMADGQTSLATVLQQNGIAFDRFAGAAAGNAADLEVVNAQLVGVAGNLIQNSDAWDQWSKQIEASKIPLETIAAAALGNIPAFEELSTKYGMTADEARIMTEAFTESIGPLGEVGRILGEQVGTLTEAQAQTKLAAQAIADFGQELANTAGALQQFGAAIDPMTGQINAAAPGAAQLGEALNQLGFAAEAAAANAGRAAEAINGLQAGGLAAAQAAAASREAFIQMATSAGIAAPAAERLADALGLIPEVQQLIFTTNATEAEAEIIRLTGQIKAMGTVPAQIKVEALTEDAQAALEALGVEITELPDGQMLLDLDDSLFQAKLQAAIDAGATLPEIVAMLGLDTTGADEQLDEWLAKPGNEGLTKEISFTTKLDTAQADADLYAFSQRAAAPLPPAPYNLDMGPAQGQLDAFQAQAQQPLIAPIDADTAAAMGKLAALAGAVAGTTALMTIDANNAPALGKLAAAVGAANGALGTMTIDGNNTPAMGKIQAAVAAANGAKGMMTIDGNNGPAIAAGRAAVAAINAMKATITITTIRRTVEAGVAVGGAIGRAASGGLVPRFAKGGIVPGYAPGIDRVPALLSPGEGILVPEAVRALGARAIMNLNRMASGGRKTAVVSKTGKDAYMSFGTRSGRSGGVGDDGSGPVVKNYYLTLQNVGNSEVDLREQFRRMEVMGG